MKNVKNTKFLIYTMGLFGSINGLLCGALFLCFEIFANLLPFVITLMILSGFGVLAFAMFWFLEINKLKIENETENKKGKARESYKSYF